jgi:CPA2 family monovalent cation:H+ antiporter-2
VHDVPLLVNVAIALGYALAGGLAARAIGLPTIVGYLFAGVAIGPFTWGFQGDEDSIRQMAEFGVILLMFGVGLHFSFRDLWGVRRVVVPGALIQMLIVSVIGFWICRLWGFSSSAGWIIGLALSIASTVVLMRALMDRGWLQTPAGKVAVGWLVFEDILSVAILVILPAVAASQSGIRWTTVGVALGKSAAFLVLMLFAGSRIVSFLLGRVVHTKSRELFVLVALTIAVGTALVSAALFNVSLALGAFVAGVVVGESPFSHQIGADLLPFREAFAVIFFVSVGMLVDPRYLVNAWDKVLVVSLLVILGKAVISALLGAVLPAPGRAALVLAAGRSQIGEFSFIVGQSGLALNLIDHEHYSLILAAALVSITVNPFLFGLVEPAERWLQRYPRVWRAVNAGKLPPVAEHATMADHVIIIGSGRVGRHISEALGVLKVPRLVIEADPARVSKLTELGVPVLFGDAGNSEILEHAGLEHARVVVITVPEDVAALTIAATVHHVAPNLRIVARASSWEAARRLEQAGVQQVVRPELEGGVEIVRRTLLDLDLPAGEVQRYAETLRRGGLDSTDLASAERSNVLDRLITSTRDFEISWVEILPGATVADRTIGQSALRKRTGASVVGIIRGEHVEVNPGPDTMLHAGDRVGVIGLSKQIAAAEELLQATEKVVQA